MMQISLKARNVVRPLQSMAAPVSTHTDARDAAPTVSIAEYKKLLATMDAHAEILEHAIELRTRILKPGIASVTLGENEKREMDTLKSHLHTLHVHRAALTDATTSYTTLQTLVDAAATNVRSHLAKAHDEPIDGAYCDYAAYLAARQRLVELMVERDGMFEDAGRVALEVVSGEEAMASMVYACRREMGREGTSKAGIRGRRVRGGEAIQPPPPYQQGWDVGGEK